jgi:hypothetical protein
MGRGERSKDADVMMRRPICGSVATCPDCLEKTLRAQPETRRESEPASELMRLRLNGSWSGESTPTYESLLRHAKRFGIECLFDTAEQLGLPPTDLALLKADLHDVAEGKRPKFSRKAKTASPNNRDAAALYRAGRTVEEIGVRFKWSLSRVRRALREEGLI